MKCFILAAGFGKRMGNLTVDLPKPLLPFRGKTLLDHSIQFAANFGVKEFIVNTHYQADKISKHLEKYSEYKFYISYEPKILGTGGGMKTGIQGVLEGDELFLTLNPDIFMTENSESLKHRIKTYSGDCLLFLSKPEFDSKYTTLDFQNEKVYFRVGDYFYVGMSLIRKSILNEISENTFYDLADVFRKLSLENRLDGFVLSEKVFDLGEREKYLAMTTDYPN